VKDSSQTWTSLELFIELSELIWVDGFLVWLIILTLWFCSSNLVCGTAKFMSMENDLRIFEITDCEDYVLGNQIKSSCLTLF